MPSLDQWEKRLKPYFDRRLRMIGEIPISRQEMEDMAAGVRASIQRVGLPRTTEILGSQYPYTFLVLLTAFGAHNTELDYWGALAEEIGSDRDHLFNHRWHHMYMRKIKTLGLRHFAGEDRARPYVTTIRFHGGIPVYSLPDYFRHFVMPSVERREFDGVAVRQVLDALLRSAYYVDSPVINFLKNSGDQGEEFFEESRKMARRYRETQEILNADEVDLPQRVIEAFETFAHDELEQTDRGRKFHLRKPALLFSLYDVYAHLYAHLPEQEIPLRYAEGELKWRLSLPVGRILEFPCKLKMQRQHMVIEEMHQPIDDRPSEVQVALIYNDAEDRREETLDRWTLRLLPPPKAAQLVPFRAVSGVALGPINPLPGEKLLLVFPATASLRVDGVAGPFHESVQLYGAWTGWQAQGWDLAEAWSVQLLTEDPPSGDIFQVTSKMAAPVLVGQPCRFSADPIGTPLYIGELPRLRVPIRPDLSLERELSRWQVDLHSSWNAIPDVSMKTRLNRYKEQTTIEEGWAELALSAILGAEALGTYTLCVNGPMDEDIEFCFRAWPKMTIVGLKPALFPNTGGSDPVTFSIILPKGARCEVQPGAEGIELRDTTYSWEITADAEIFRADINLVMELAAGEPVRVPVYIPIPRLRWAISYGQEQSEIQWSTRLIQLQLDRLTQSEAGTLHISMPGLASAVRISLEVVEVDDTETIRQQVDFRSTPFDPNWLRAPLSAVNDTLRHAGNLARLDLLVRASYQEEELHIPLVLLSRRMKLSDVRLQHLGSLTWLLSWQEAHIVKNRRVLLEPAWQPWQEGWEFPIPDGKTEIQISEAGFPPTRYRLYFYTAAAGEPPLSCIPSGAETEIVDLSTPEVRAAELDRGYHDAFSRNAYEMAFRNAFEAACLYQDMGDLEKRDLMISQLAKTFTHIDNLGLILGFFQWLDYHNIHNSYGTFMRRIMFQVAVVRRVFQRYHKANARLRSYLAYVPHIKDIYADSAHLIARQTDIPAVLIACLQRLIRQEDPGLVPLIIELISSGRSSNRDAVDLLSTKPAWALKELQELPASPTKYRLIAGLLPVAGDALNQLPDDEQQLLYLDAFPYIFEQSQRKMIMEKLLQKRGKEAYRAIMLASQNMSLPDSDIEELLAINPRLALKVLAEVPTTEQHEAWIEKLTERYPAAAGIAIVGRDMHTPAGLALIESIETMVGSQVTEGSITDRSLKFQLAIGHGVQRTTAIYEPRDSTLQFRGTHTVYQCGNCSFIHPNNRIVEQHHRERHPYENLRISILPARVQINPDDIELV